MVFIKLVLLQNIMRKRNTQKKAAHIQFNSNKFMFVNYESYFLHFSSNARLKANKSTTNPGDQASKPSENLNKTLTDFESPHSENVSMSDLMTIMYHLNI